MEALGIDRPIAAAPARRSRVRARLGVVLLLLGLVVASVPGLAAGNAFLPRLWVRVGTIPLPLAQVNCTIETLAPVRSADGNVILRPGVRFVTVRTSGRFWPSAPSSLTDLVLQEPGWTAAAIALLSMVPFYAWWRRGGLPFGRLAGAATCIACAAAVCVLVFDLSSDSPAGWRVWWTVPLGALLMGAAFVIAPAPQRALDE